jgi:tripartite-type tricarboxylate transporter receptor subunit TctC
VMKANPDGYTLLFMADPAWVGYVYSKTYDFKPWEKLTPIGNLTVEPYGFIEIRADAPYGSWAELVKYGKENPGKLTCGGPGAGGVPQLIFNMITTAAGISGKYVPFAGAGPSRTALLGGHIDFRVCQHTEAIGMIRAGKTKGIAISSDKRLEILPDVPTFKELGVGESIILTRSIWGPPQLPSNIIKILAAGIEKGIKDPEFIKVAEESLFYKTEFRLGPRMIEELEKFDKTFGPLLAALYK